jgi:hypothetical protein
MMGVVLVSAHAISGSCLVCNPDTQYRHKHDTKNKVIIYVELVPHRKLMVGEHNMKVRAVLTHQASLLG